MRAFIAIEPGPALSTRLENLLRQGAAMAPNARWVRPESLHISLAFLGEVADALIPKVGEALGQLAARHSPHRLRAVGSGIFGPMERPKVLWVGLSGALDAFAAVERGLTRALAELSLAPDHATFVPHLTLARSRSPAGDPALARCADTWRAEDAGELEVRELTLFSSESDRSGMSYRPVVTHRLSVST